MRLATALVTLVLAGGLAGCSSAEGQGGAAPKQPGPEPERVRHAPAREYVAMGDSYTSAPLVGETENPCYRGADNYPALVAAQLDLELTDVSCAGATTDAVWRPYTPFGAGHRQPPQAAALSRSTDVVTVSFGGNDFGLFSRLIQDCVADAGDAQGAPCTRADAAAGGEAGDAARRITGRLVRALDEVTSAAPRARVVVVSYPQFVPEEPCEEFPIAAGDVGFGQRVNRLIVGAQQRAAARADVEFVDVYSATEGHDACSDDPYVAGASPTAPAAPYHPYEEEQQVVADLLTAALGS